MSKSTKAEFKYPFGRRKVSIKTLNKNKLTLFEEGGTRIHYRVEMISDDLKAIIKAIIKGQIHEVEEAVDLLDDVDRKILFQALDDAQIDTDWGRPLNDKNKLIHRFNILKDEIILGNAGSDTLKEFKDVIDKCFEDKMLSKSDYYRMKDLLLSNIGTSKNESGDSN